MTTTPRKPSTPKPSTPKAPAKATPKVAAKSATARTEESEVPQTKVPRGYQFNPVWDEMVAEYGNPHHASKAPLPMFPSSDSREI